MIGKKTDHGYEEVLPGIKIKTINYGENTLMTEFILKKDSVLVEHAHINEQTGYLVKGKIKLFINGKPEIINPGDSWNIPSNIMHKAEIIENSIAIEVFSPARTDYIKYVNQNDIME